MGDGARAATDVDGSKSTRVATFSFRVYLSTDRSAKKVHRKCHLPSFHDIHAYFVSRQGKDFLWKRCFQKPDPFLYSIYIITLYGRDYVRKILEAFFERLKSKENLCLKKFSIIGMLSNPNFDNTSLIVK